MFISKGPFEDLSTYNEQNFKLSTDKAYNHCNAIFK